MPGTLVRRTPWEGRSRGHAQTDVAPRTCGSRLSALGGRGVAQVGLDHLEVREALLGLLGQYVGGDDGSIAGAPVDRGGVRAGRGELERVEHTQDLVEVATCALRVRERQLD